MSSKDYPLLRGIIAICFALVTAGALAAPALALSSDLQQPTPPPPVNEHPERAVLHPLGIGLAVLFVVLMVNLFRWMFRVPPQLSPVVAKARRSVAAWQRILVPVSEGVAAGRAVELACRLGEAQKAEIVLVYVVEVPLTLSLSAPMPAEEAKGQEVLQTVRHIVEQHNLPCETQVIPHRYVWGGILHLAREQQVDAIVMHVGSGRSGSTDGIGRTAQEVLKRAECEVVLDRAPRRSETVPVVYR